MTDDLIEFAALAIGNAFVLLVIVRMITGRSGDRPGRGGHMSSTIPITQYPKAPPGPAPGAREVVIHDG